MRMGMAWADVAKAKRRGAADHRLKCCFIFTQLHSTQVHSSLLRSALLYIATPNAIWCGCQEMVSYIEVALVTHAMRCTAPHYMKCQIAEGEVEEGEHKCRQG